MSAGWYACSSYYAQLPCVVHIMHICNLVNLNFEKFCLSTRSVANPQCGVSRSLKVLVQGPQNKCFFVLEVVLENFFELWNSQNGHKSQVSSACALQCQVSCTPMSSTGDTNATGCATKMLLRSTWYSLFIYLSKQKFYFFRSGLHPCNYCTLSRFLSCGFANGTLEQMISQMICFVHRELFLYMLLGPS